jgi:2-polyprenyl-3-methyl-5-hydroxy-6-metoxy-1,4-benzoquinol methylase
MMSLPCPVCGAASILEYRHPEADLYRCPDCEHCFANTDSIDKPEEYDAEYYEIKHRNWFENPDIVLYESIYSFITMLPNASVIDVGCGRGDFLKHLHRKDPRLSLTGIDLTPNSPAEGIEFIQGDIMTADLKKEFDVVTCLATIEHIADVRPFVKRLRRLCSGGGLIIIMTINDQSVLYGVARLLHRFGFRAPFERLYSKHHLNHFNVSSLTQLLKASGLSIVETLRLNPPISTIDVSDSSRTAAVVMRGGVLGIFLVENLTGWTHHQTMICRKE